MKKWFLAFFHIDQKAVCELSTGKRDYHDYHDGKTIDGELPSPWHFYEYTCRHCGKKFYI